MKVKPGNPIVLRNSSRTDKTVKVTYSRPQMKEVVVGHLPDLHKQPNPAEDKRASSYESVEFPIDPRTGRAQFVDKSGQMEFGLAANGEKPIIGKEVALQADGKPVMTTETRTITIPANNSWLENGSIFGGAVAATATLLPGAALAFKTLVYSGVPKAGMVVAATVGAVAVGAYLGAKLGKKIAKGLMSSLGVSNYVKVESRAVDIQDKKKLTSVTKDVRTSNPTGHFRRDYDWDDTYEDTLVVEGYRSLETSYRGNLSEGPSMGEFFVADVGYPDPKPDKETRKAAVGVPDAIEMPEPVLLGSESSG